MPPSGRLPSNAGYAEEAPELLKRYEQFSFESEQSAVLGLIPAAPASVVDIGAGTGRDAAYFAKRGYKVIAVEPTHEMREGAIELHPSNNIEWLDDHLPDLALLLSRRMTFDIVMLNAVWMHLDAQQRERGMQSLAALLHMGSRMFIKLRRGPVPVGRVMYDVSGEETIALAQPYGLKCLYVGDDLASQAITQSAGVSWTDLVFEKTA